MADAAKPFGKPDRLQYGRPHRRRKAIAFQRAGYRCECPGCRACAKDAGRPCCRMAEIGEHIVPHCGDPKLMTSQANYGAYCKACATVKTLRERGVAT